MVVNLLFTFITSAIYFGSKKEKSKRWAVLILIGVGMLHYNWSTGALGFRFISIGIPTYGFVKASIYSPLLIGLRIPIFAIWYWVKRLRQDESTVDISEVNHHEELEEQESI